MWWEIDYARFIALLTPSFLRKFTVTAFLTSLPMPLRNTYVLWRENRDRNIERVACNGQVCYLRGLLNDKLDSELRRIAIVTDTPNHFTVKVPFGFDKTNYINRAKAIVGEYKLVATTYEIKN